MELLGGSRKKPEPPMRAGEIGAGDIAYIHAYRTVLVLPILSENFVVSLVVKRPHKFGARTRLSIRSPFREGEGSCFLSSNFLSRPGRLSTPLLLTYLEKERKLRRVRAGNWFIYFTHPANHAGCPLSFTAAANQPPPPPHFSSQDAQKVSFRH